MVFPRAALALDSSGKTSKMLVNIRQRFVPATRNPGQLKKYEGKKKRREEEAGSDWQPLTGSLEFKVEKKSRKKTKKTGKNDGKRLV